MVFVSDDYVLRELQIFPQTLLRIRRRGLLCGDYNLGLHSAEVDAYRRIKQPANKRRIDIAYIRVTSMDDATVEDLLAEVINMFVSDNNQSEDKPSIHIAKVLIDKGAKAICETSFLNRPKLHELLAMSRVGRVRSVVIPHKDTFGLGTFDLIREMFKDVDTEVFCAVSGGISSVDRGEFIAALRYICNTMDFSQDARFVNGAKRTLRTLANVSAKIIKKRATAARKLKTKIN